jgi:hypothetical protein
MGRPVAGAHENSKRPTTNLCLLVQSLWSLHTDEHLLYFRAR